MITEEQIKNLKPGDPLIVHGKFDSIYDDDDLCIDIKTKGVFSDEVITDSIMAHPSCVSLDTPYKPLQLEVIRRIPETYPKYDPCRKFRKGDIVRLREYNGRKPYDYWHKQVIKNFGAKLDTVLEDELDSGNVDIFQDAPIDELTVRVNSCHLELVTPVEELEPYELVETTDYWSVEKENEELCLFWKKHHPNAKEAAEAERDRLNAEHRKEREND